MILESDHQIPDHIFVKADKKLNRVELDNILHIEGLKDYVIHTLQKKVSSVICTLTFRTVSLVIMAAVEHTLEGLYVALFNVSEFSRTSKEDLAARMLFFGYLFNFYTTFVN